MRDQCYVERDRRNRAEAEPYRLFSDVGSAALTHVRILLERAPDQFLRVPAPGGATLAEIRQVRHLGARPF